MTNIGDLIVNLADELIANNKINEKTELMFWDGKTDVIVAFGKNQKHSIMYLDFPIKAELTSEQLKEFINTERLVPDYELENLEEENQITLGEAINNIELDDNYYKVKKALEDKNLENIDFEKTEQNLDINYIAEDSFTKYYKVANLDRGDAQIVSIEQILYEYNLKAK